jgi:hypothetical protein
MFKPSFSDKEVRAGKGEETRPRQVKSRGRIQMQAF